MTARLDRPHSLDHLYGNANTTTVRLRRFTQPLSTSHQDANE